ncbi:phosphoribosylanthranilate isomerase [Staphylococcus americanisciuri]|uniref:N-(5'-phosphoribosyl)anthranilate isomerase n=1 Tax=Staphylococcus americanisciuri TaxID=2973940 RepID=A0ABT2F124_9STAP|nr:phosphoribosylanthranilate isomerase [Staphylococcus americanisciuri]MCS4486160.1 phosphoribosylanthranilate isomerase [Staphylococcus americanisciuri]
MYVKYCGFTRLQDVHSACECDINAIGFVMYPLSARYVDLAAVKRLSAEIPAHIDRVAVTVNMPHNMLQRLVQETHINTVQLHGDEPVTYIQQLRMLLPDIQVFKALKGTETLAKQIDQYASYVDRLLVDTPSHMYGGMGGMFDWRVLDNVSLEKIVIAGGLNRETLPTLIAQVPHVKGIDIASGIEGEQKGYKSLQKMKAIQHYLGGIES